MSTELLTVDIGSLDPNPYRMLGKYPFIDSKIETLRRSVKDVGVWERIIARRNGNRFQKAFGHHLQEACRLEGIKQVPVIVRDLTDQQMVEFMGRENLEDYNANFLVMLETWEAAARFLSSAEDQEPQAIEIARLLGWTRLRDGTLPLLNNTASACYAAHGLISGNHVRLSDLHDLSVKAAREICERAFSRIQEIERIGQKYKKPKAVIERQQKDIAFSAKYVARGVREGVIPQSNIRGEIDFRGVQKAAEQNRESPLLAKFAKQVADQIDKMLVDDSTAEKLAEIEKITPSITREDDKNGLRRIDHALAIHGKTTSTWRQRLKKPEAPKNVTPVPLKLVKKANR